MGSLEASTAQGAANLGILRRARLARVRSHWRPSTYTWSVLVAAAVAIALLGTAFSGWVPRDEGTLGLAASNVLAGQWPHVDFGDPYPGLLAFIHAGVFALLGESVASLRVAWLAIASVAGISSFILLRRWLDDLTAAAASFSVVVLGFIRYPASMPTWWNLGLGLASLAFVVEGQRRGTTRLVAWGGLVSGLSLLIKPTGLYIAIPIALSLFVRSRPRGPLSKALALLAAIAVVTGVVAPAWSPEKFVFLWLPICALLVWITSSGSHQYSVPRPTPAMLWTFGVGAVSPTLLVVLGYAMLGETRALIEGWVLSPSRRYEQFTGDLVVALSGAVLVAGISLMVWVSARRSMTPRVVVLPFVAIAILGLLGWGEVSFALLVAAPWIPWLVIVQLLTWKVEPDPNKVLIAAVAVTFSLVLVPTFGLFYVAYIIPALLIGLIVLSGAYGKYLVYGLLILSLAYVWLGWNGRAFEADLTDGPTATTLLEVPRGGIKVWTTHAYYNQLIELVNLRAAGRPIYAGPDSPEIPFLAGVENVGAAFYESLSESWDDSDVLEMASRVDLMAINSAPPVTPKVSDSAMNQLADIYPYSQTIGPFTVFWRR